MIKTGTYPKAEQREPGADGQDDSLLTGISGPAQPDTSAANRWQILDKDYLLLRDAVLELMSIDLLHYRTMQMERRLTAYLGRSGQATWAIYIQMLYRQPEEARRFLEFLTINVSSFYRDADKWTILAEKILPNLLNRTKPYGLQAWSIGCSLGAEPYTLAMLLSELASNRRHMIYAGDIDPSVLEVARAAGPYSSNELRELPPELTEKFIVPSGTNQFRVRSELRRMVHFERFDLLQDKAARLYDLVICRNLVIYFTPVIKEQVFRELALAVKPGGILFIGSTETFTNFRQYGFTYLGPSFYQRIGSGL